MIIWIFQYCTKTNWDHYIKIPFWDTNIWLICLFLTIKVSSDIVHMNLCIFTETRLRGTIAKVCLYIYNNANFGNHILQTCFRHKNGVNLKRAKNICLKHVSGVQLPKYAYYIYIMHTLTIIYFWWCLDRFLSQHYINSILDTNMKTWMFQFGTKTNDDYYVKSTNRETNIWLICLFLTINFPSDIVHMNLHTLTKTRLRGWLLEHSLKRYKYMY